MVRIFCLTSIYQITPTTNVVNITPYEEGADESYISFNEEEILLHYTSTKIIENLQNFSSYKLTEISIGWENTLKLKRYLIYIYREDTGLMVFKMVRGAVQFNTIEKGIYEIIVATSKLYPNKFDFDLRIIIRHIKSTKIRKISTKEKEYFENYAKQIEEFCNNERTFREAAFDQIKFVLPNKSKENYLRTQLSDIKTLIYLLCNPKTGSYSNIKEGKRYNLKVDSFLQPKTWRAREQRDLENPFIKRDNCHELEWAHVKLSNVHLNDKEKEKISYIRLEDIQIFDESKKLYPCLKNFNFANLTMLLLNECGLTELSDHFLEILPLTLKNMNFRRNKISYISKSISRFHNLLSLDLSFNECLNDEGFPWAFMPINIEELFLKQASITKIPAEIRRLQNLDEIQVHSKFLEFVSWKDISNSVSIIEIKGNGKINDICNLADKNNLSKLQIINAGYIDFNCSHLPPTVTILDLTKSKLKYFDCQHFLPNLFKLKLNNNFIEEIEWQNLPTTLENLRLNSNYLTFIGDITHLTNLETLSAEDNKINNLFHHVNFPTLQKFNLQRNFISVLPQGFENSNNLKILRLSYNNFNYQQFDIYESLWNRLPVSLDELSLNNNLLNNLPCMLNNLKFKKLSVKDCNLKYICFKLFHKCLFNKSQFDIRGNPSIKCLPYFPKDFYPPTSSQKIWNNNCYFSFNLITDNSDFIYTRQFPLKKGKLNFAFKECKENGKYLNECKCCIICGKETDEPIIKQIFVMDIYLRLYPSSEGDPDPNVLVEGEKHLRPGKWKSNVKTRICSQCFLRVKEKVAKVLTKLEQDLENAIPNKKDKSNPINYKKEDIINETENNQNQLSLNEPRTLEEYPLQQQQTEDVEIEPFPYYNVLQYETEYISSQPYATFPNTGELNNTQIPETSYSQPSYFNQEPQQLLQNSSNYFLTKNEQQISNINESGFLQQNSTFETLQPSNLYPVPQETNESVLNFCNQHVSSGQNSSNCFPTENGQQISNINESGFSQQYYPNDLNSSEEHNIHIESNTIVNEINYILPFQHQIVQLPYDQSYERPEYLQYENNFTFPQESFINQGCNYFVPQPFEQSSLQKTFQHLNANNNQANNFGDDDNFR